MFDQGIEAARLQSSLGGKKFIERNDRKMNGYLAVAKVIEVYPEYNTVDVQIVNTMETVSGSSVNGGRFSCKVAASNAHYDGYTGTAWGTVEPIFKDDLVILAFLEGMKDQPVILKSIHRMDPYENILPSGPSSPGGTVTNPSAAEHLKFLKVFPGQNYVKVDGAGNLELTMTDLSFLKVGQSLDDSDDGTEYQDLSEKGFDGNTLQMVVTTDTGVVNSELGIKEVCKPQINFQGAKNLDYLWVHSSEVTQGELKFRRFTKFFLEKLGGIRISRNNKDGKISFVTLSNTGAMTVNRSLDTVEFAGSDNYSAASLSEAGDLSVSRKNGSRETKFVITETGDFSIQRLQTDGLIAKIESNFGNKLKLSMTDTAGKTCSVSLEPGGKVVIVSEETTVTTEKLTMSASEDVSLTGKNISISGSETLTLSSPLPGFSHP